jgi:hypothetical protein
MDLIGSINYIENRLGGRKPNQGKAKPAPKKSGNDAVEEQHSHADADQPLTEYDTRLGHKLDITA